MLRTLRGRHEFVNASTAGPTIRDLAERVGAAGVLARIHATMLVADGVHRAVLGPGAVSLRLAAVHVRIAHVIWWALASRTVARAGDAESSRMAGIGTARLHGDALHIWHRVRSQSRRALANRPMIVRDAHRVHAARVLVACIVAGVREPVAELRGRAVDVVDARHGAAAGHNVVRIAGVEPGRALAVCHVIVDHAERVRAARDEVADRLADERTIRRRAATCLVLRALAVGGAAILARAVAAATVIRIASVAGQALAMATMILRDAARVRGAGEAAAEGQALEHTQGVWSATLARTTVVVIDAVRH